MKRLIICILLGTLFGCDGFLDEVDQDLLRPMKVDHYTSLILNECTVNCPYFPGAPYMTDDVMENSLARHSDKKQFQTIYTWRREIEIDENGQRIAANKTWAALYRSIAIINDILLEIDFAAGSPEEVAYLKGEAYFVRAMSYFNLLNLYAEPYVPGQARMQLGVPIRLDHKVEAAYSRDNLEAGYEQIEKDLIAASEEFARTDLVKTLWYPNLSACNLLRSRMKLYQQKWEEVIPYATQVIEKVPLTKLSEKEPFVTAENPEIIYTYLFETMEMYNLTVAKRQESGYAVSSELLDCYDEENDIRRKACFVEKGDARQMLSYCSKMESKYTQLGAFNMRGAEAYLNRAEAFVMMNEITAAQEDMKSLITKRYRDPSKVVLPDDQPGLLKFIQDERRREFAWEDHHRWYDLRRMANRPEISHVYTYVSDLDVAESKMAYHFLTNDPNDVLPIPLAERDNNPLIRNNDRMEKVPEAVK